MNTDNASSISHIHKHELCEAFPGLVELAVNLKAISRWKIGGVADVIIRPRTIDHVVRIRRWLIERGIPHITIGETTNLLFSDRGLRPVCIQIAGRFSALERTRNRITALSGTWVPLIARRAMLANLSGLEHTCGIPGTMGGLIYMNGGSLRNSIGDALVEVVSVTSSGTIVTRRAEECCFSYRSSIFQNNDESIVSGTLELVEGRSSRNIRKEMLSILRNRRAKFPQRDPNCGSVFVSDPAMYADFGAPGAVIESLGLKGFRIGGAEIAQQHANFIVNKGNASTRDVLSLISIVKSEAFAHTGYEMKVEARYISPEGAMMPADQAVSLNHEKL